MRYLVLVLFVLNAGYFLWNYLNPVKEERIKLPPMSENVSRLSLLSERSPGTSLTDKADASFIEPVQPESEDEVQVAARSCFTLGPLTSETSKDLLISRLQDMGFSVESRSIEQRETTGYWVFLPPYENRSAAISVAEELAQKGIKDYYVVTDEDYRHAVSLGLFSEKARANRRMAHIRTLGFKPQKIVRYRDRTYYWLDYEQNADGPLPDTVWKEIGSNNEKIQKLDRSCN